jgi:iron complex outermembrane receptor protein
MKRLSLALLPLVVAATADAQDKAVQESNRYYGRSLDELMAVETQLKAEVGSRSGSRDALDAEVPIDVITAAQLQASGYTELGKVLAKLIPGFNYPRPSIADGTDHAPPFTLRGLNPDQVLVLVNGKRQHQGSLLHVNGTIGRGSSGVDINTIPVRAIERIEVLRDGAAAQYGSDAIAGIINIILKGYGWDSSVNASFGRTSEGDGLVRQVDAFYSHPLAEDGYINLTAEARDRGASNRAGPDRRDGNRINTHFGEADSQDGLVAINAAVPRGDTTWYLHGNFDRRLSSAGAFYRLADDERNIQAIYPDGFLPLIEPEILDYSASIGAKGVLEGGLRWDLSYSHGYNDYHFHVANSLNRSLGADTPTAFDSGATRYSQQIVNLDLTRRLGPHNLAGGLEFRQERYRIASGDEASYVLGEFSDWYPGAQGFSGFSPANEVDVERENYAAYLDLKYNLAEGVMLDAAARGEHYSDFGGTLDGKLALRLRPTPDLLLRASASSGFRAPSLTQSHFTYTQMIRDGNDIWMYGNFGVDHPVARALGATDLKPEQSLHYTAGLVYQPRAELSMSADYFITDIDDRIMATGYIAGWNLAGLSQEAMEVLRQYGVDGAVYFTNAIGTRTRGYDLRLEYSHELDAGSKLKFTGAYHRSETEITRVNPAPSVLGVAMTDLILDAYTRVTIEGGQPVDAVKLWARYESPRFDAVVNLNRFGRFSSTRGYDKVTFDAKWTVDAELAYHLKDNVQLAIGGENLFDVVPEEWGATDDDVMGSGKIVRYSQYAPFGYNGAYYYVRLGVRF